MARGNPPVQVRLPAAERARWEEAAAQAGVDLSTFVRACVERCLQPAPLGGRPPVTFSGVRDLAAKDVTPRFKESGRKR